MNKSIFKSKTFWVNLVVLPLLPALRAVFPPLEPLLTDTVIASVVGFVNILLRAVTEKPVSVPLLKK